MLNKFLDYDQYNTHTEYNTENSTLKNPGKSIRVRYHCLLFNTRCR